MQPAHAAPMETEEDSATVQALIRLHEYVRTHHLQESKPRNKPDNHKLLQSSVNTPGEIVIADPVPRPLGWAQLRWTHNDAIGRTLHEVESEDKTEFLQAGNMYSVAFAAHAGRDDFLVGRRIQQIQTRNYRERRMKAHSLY